MNLKRTTFATALLAGLTFGMVACGATDADNVEEASNDEGEIAMNDEIRDPEPIVETDAAPSIEEPSNTITTIDGAIEFGRTLSSNTEFEAQFPLYENLTMRGRVILKMPNSTGYDVYFGKTITADLTEYPIVGQFRTDQNGDAALLEKNLKLGDTISFTGLSGLSEFDNGRFKRWTINQCVVK